jgi:hypothetical protein
MNDKSLLNKPLFIFRLIIPMIFFSFGSFGLLNILGIRRDLQTILIILTLLLLPVIFLKVKQLTKSFFFWFVTLSLVGHLIFRASDKIVLLDGMLSVIVVSVLIILDNNQSQKVLKYIIFLCGLFSIFGFIQSFYILFDNSVINEIRLGYTSSTGGENIEVKHMLGYLGFGYNPISIGKFSFVRLTSYAAEPSVMIYSFLVPGILALLFKGWTRVFGFLIIVFSIGLSFSGTMYLMAGISLFYYVFIKYFNKDSVINSTLPFIFSLSILLMILVLPLELILEILLSWLEPLAKVSNVFSKSVSSFERLSGILKYSMEAKNYIFGAPYLPDIPVGLLISYIYTAGFPLLVISIMIFYSIFNGCSSLINHNDFYFKIVGAFGFGVLTVVLFFTDYGWRTTPGFIMLYYLYRFLDVEYVKNNLSEYTASN